jgi:hypothetical protein
VRQATACTRKRAACVWCRLQRIRVNHDSSDFTCTLRQYSLRSLVRPESRRS